MLALMDGSFNVTMQPFRALVADMLPEKQRNKGYSIQSLLINIGAVIGSALPFILTNVIGLSNIAEKVRFQIVSPGHFILVLPFYWVQFYGRFLKPKNIHPRFILRMRVSTPKR